MLLFFTNLYMAMLTGTWIEYSWQSIGLYTKPILNTFGEFLTSIFGDTSYATLGDIINVNNPQTSYVCVLALVLATITSIGIVVVAVKGIKRLFTVFFYGVR